MFRIHFEMDDRYYNSKYEREETCRNNIKPHIREEYQEYDKEHLPFFLPQKREHVRHDPVNMRYELHHVVNFTRGSAIV